MNQLPTQPIPPPPVMPKAFGQPHRLLWLWLTLGAISALIVCCCGGFLFSTLMMPHHTQAFATATPVLAQATQTPMPTAIQTTPTSAPPSATSTNTPTATAAANTLTGATLGGTYEGFAAVYGPADSVGSNGATWNTLTIAGQQVMLYIAFDTGQDGNAHVVEVDISPVDLTTSNWDYPTGLSVSAPFLPDDAQQGATNTDAQTEEVVYVSQGLAQTFDASHFTKDSGGNAPLGTFDVFCLDPNSTIGVESCSLAPGQK